MKPPVSRLTAVSIAIMLSIFAGGAEAAGETIVKGPAWRFSFESSEVGNLVYELDCLSGLNHCQANGFDALWHQKLGWSAEDDADLAHWKEVSEHYWGKQLGAVVNPVSPYPLVGSSREYQSKLQIAAFTANTIDDYGQSLNLLIDAKDSAIMVGVLRHFQPRFVSYWSTAKKGLDAFAEKVAALAEKQKLVDVAEKLAKFYASDLPNNQTIHFTLIARPDQHARRISANQIENYSVIEVMSGERPEERLALFIQELCHYLYASAPIKKRIELIQSFVTAPVPSSLNLFNLLDQSVAAAVANGLVDRLIRPEHFEKSLQVAGGFLADDLGDRAAKAIVDLVVARIEAGRSLYDDFTTDYLRLVGAAIGDVQNQPALALRYDLVVYNDRELASLRRKLSQKVHAVTSVGYSVLGATETQSEFARYPELTRVMLLKKDDLDHLDNWDALLGSTAVDNMVKYADKYRGFIYGIKRGEKSYIYCLVADDAASLDRMVDLLLDAKQPIFGLGAFLGPS